MKMKKIEFIKKIKEKADQNRLNRKDVRFKKAIAFLKGKGFLDTNLPIKAGAGTKVDLRDIICAGTMVEPRILEVLPAAILHYRNNFLGFDKLPEELKQVLKAIQNDEANGPTFEGIPYERLKYWANIQLRDGRTKPVNEKKVAKFLTLHPRHIVKLQTLVAKGRFKDQTSAIEAAIDLLEN